MTYAPMEKYTNGLPFNSPGNVSKEKARWFQSLKMFSLRKQRDTHIFNIFEETAFIRTVI